MKIIVQQSAEHGPEIDGKPSYIIDNDGVRYEFNRRAKKVGGAVYMSQLRDDEVVIAPGLIYRMALALSTPKAGGGV